MTVRRFNGRPWLRAIRRIVLTAQRNTTRPPRLRNNLHRRGILSCPRRPTPVRPSVELFGVDCFSRIEQVRISVVLHIAFTRHTECVAYS